MARPRLHIDPAVVEGMASVGATNTEIADFVGCNEGVIRRRFARELIKARSGMKLRLRQAQVKLALKGDRTMLIWLGKNLLGQMDRFDQPEDRETPEQRAAAIRAALTAMRDADGTEAAA